MGSRSELVIADCTKCKEMNPPQIRQTLGCGYEQPIDPARLTMWRPPAAFRGELTVCAGYSTKLPEVCETQLLRAHWTRGNLSAACEPTEDVLDAILILEGSSNSVQAWCYKPAAEGGGGS